MAEDFMLSALNAERASLARQDPDHPLFHVAPPVGRLNDPNGLIVDSGTYHAFFQYTPEHPRKLVYWGHARSTDLVHWTYLPPAILPDSRQDRNGAYSGTAIGTDDGVELWYTGNYKDAETGEREASQCVVTTPDLRRFTKVVPPVIAHQPEGYTAHFRDPQVWRDPDDPQGSYRMLLGAQREDLTGTALLYRSSDLREWHCEGELSFPDAGGAFDRFGYMWECPNLVRLHDEGSGRDRDVLIFCPQGIAPEREGFENVFPCVYMVGELVGTEFRGADGDYWEVDRGFEFYAPQVFADRARAWGRADPALLLGWAGNAGEDDQPSISTGGWVHALTAPRALSLAGERLVQRPHLPGLPLEPIAFPASVDGDGARVAALESSRSWRFSASLAHEPGACLELRVGGDSGLVVRVSESLLEVDRSRTRYPHGGIRRVSLEPGWAGSVEVVHDRSITEIFLGGGRLAFTLRSFLEGTGSGLALGASGGAVRVADARAARAD